MWATVKTVFFSSASTQNWAGGTSWRPTTTTGRSRCSWMIAERLPWSVWTRPPRAWVAAAAAPHSVPDSKVGHFSSYRCFDLSLEHLAENPLQRSLDQTGPEQGESGSCWAGLLVSVSFPSTFPSVFLTVDHVHDADAGVWRDAGVVYSRLSEPLHALVTAPAACQHHLSPPPPPRCYKGTQSWHLCFICHNLLSRFQIQGRMRPMLI